MEEIFTKICETDKMDNSRYYESRCKDTELAARGRINFATFSPMIPTKFKSNNLKSSMSLIRPTSRKEKNHK